MPRYRVLKGVAHNVGHSFTSLMNYAGDDYVMGHILRFARRSNRDTLDIDFVTGEAGPAELLATPISDVPSRYIEFFWDQVSRQGSDPSYVISAELRLQYNVGVQRPVQSSPQFLESPYTCDVKVVDIRGKTYTAHFEGWWYPERLDYKPSVARPWWKFWAPPDVKNMSN